MSGGENEEGMIMQLQSDSTPPSRLSETYLNNRAGHFSRLGGHCLMWIFLEVEGGRES